MFMCILLFLNFFSPFQPYPATIIFNILVLLSSLLSISLVSLIFIVISSSIIIIITIVINTISRLDQSDFFSQRRGGKKILRNTRLHLKLKQQFYYSWCLFIVYDWITCQKQSPQVFCKKKIVLKNYAKFTGNTCVIVSFLIKLKASGLQLY